VDDTEDQPGNEIRTGRVRSTAASTAAARDLPPWAQDLLAILPPLLSRDDTVSETKLSRRTIDRRIREKRLKAIKIDGRVLIPRRALVEFLVGAA
jgi:hypothetical protein